MKDVLWADDVSKSVDSEVSVLDIIRTKALFNLEQKTRIEESLKTIELYISLRCPKDLLVRSCSWSA